MNASMQMCIVSNVKCIGSGERVLMKPYDGNQHQAWKVFENRIDTECLESRYFRREQEIWSEGHILPVQGIV